MFITIIKILINNLQLTHFILKKVIGILKKKFKWKEIILYLCSFLQPQIKEAMSELWH